MAVAAELAPVQNQQFDYYRRHWNDTVTWLSESLHGSMRTSFDYAFDGQELYAEDGSAMAEVFDTAISDAKTIVSQQPSLLFELRRRIIERGEYDDMLAMARGELPNTMVVVSDFPEELRRSSQDVGGYNVERQQTMLRVITRQPDGSIRITSQSLDRSNRTALEAVYNLLGESPQAGELLGQRVTRQLEPQWQERLVDNLRQRYDDSLNQQFGGPWHAGIATTAGQAEMDTTAFVLSQPELVDWFVGAQLENKQLAEQLRYSLAATIAARFETGQMISIEDATQRALQTGRRFSGCGLTAEQRNITETESQLSQAGYGNKSLDEDKYGSLTFDCPKGHKNRRPRGALIDRCTTCRTSVRC